MDQGRKATFLRIYSGELKAESEVFNATRGMKERISRLFLVHANKREKIEASTAGHIVLALGLKSTSSPWPATGSMSAPL